MGPFSDISLTAKKGCTLAHLRSYKAYVAAFEVPSSSRTNDQKASVKSRRKTGGNTRQAIVPNPDLPPDISLETAPQTMPNVFQTGQPYPPFEDHLPNPFLPFPAHLAPDFPTQLPPDFPMQLPSDWIFDPSPILLPPVQPAILHQPQYVLPPDPEPVTGSEPGLRYVTEPMEELDTTPTSSREQQSSEASSTTGAYLKAQTDEGFVYTHPTAGRTFGEAPNRWEELDKMMKSKYPGKPWGMWKDRQEWEI
ncbi:hypothetical protein BDV93DRAFT_565362, partial [Ceratobasidium sp. AG-I]